LTTSKASSFPLFGRQRPMQSLPLMLGLCSSGIMMSPAAIKPALAMSGVSVVPWMRMRI